MAKLSADAQEIYDTFGPKAGCPWITWGSIRHLEDISFGADMFRIARAWNELREAELAQGQLSTGEKCRLVG